MDVYLGFCGWGIDSIAGFFLPCTTDARPAPDLCFREVNKAGDMYGNCGKDQQGNYRSCKDRWGPWHSAVLSRIFSFSFICIFVITRDTKCGKIQCSASASKPIENNAVRIETTVSGDEKKFVCLGTHVYNLQPEDKEPQGDTLDPGLVLTGTKCDSDSVRLVKRC